MRMSNYPDTDCYSPLDKFKILSFSASFGSGECGGITLCDSYGRLNPLVSSSAKAGIDQYQFVFSGQVVILAHFDLFTRSNTRWVTVFCCIDRCRGWGVKVEAPWPVSQTQQIPGRPALSRWICQHLRLGPLTWLKLYNCLLLFPLAYQGRKKLWVDNHWRLFAISAIAIHVRHWLIHLRYYYHFHRLGGCGYTALNPLPLAVRVGLVTS